MAQRTQQLQSPVIGSPQQQAQSSPFSAVVADASSAVVQPLPLSPAELMQIVVEPSSMPLPELAQRSALAAMISIFRKGRSGSCEAAIRGQRGGGEEQRHSGGDSTTAATRTTSPVRRHPVGNSSPRRITTLPCRTTDPTTADGVVGSPSKAASAESLVPLMSFVEPKGTAPRLTGLLSAELPRLKAEEVENATRALLGSRQHHHHGGSSHTTAVVDADRIVQFCYRRRTQRIAAALRRNGANHHRRHRRGGQRPLSAARTPRKHLQWETGITQQLFAATPDPKSSSAAVSSSPQLLSSSSGEDSPPPQVQKGRHIGRVIASKEEEEDKRLVGFRARSPPLPQQQFAAPSSGDDEQQQEAEDRRHEARRGGGGAPRQKKQLGQAAQLPTERSKQSSPSSPPPSAAAAPFLVASLTSSAPTTTAQSHASRMEAAASFAPPPSTYGPSSSPAITAAAYQATATDYTPGAPLVSLSVRSPVFVSRLPTSPLRTAAAPRHTILPSTASSPQQQQQQVYGGALSGVGLQGCGWRISPGPRAATTTTEAAAVDTTTRHDNGGTVSPQQQRGGASDAHIRPIVAAVVSPALALPQQQQSSSLHPQPLQLHRRLPKLAQHHHQQHPIPAHDGDRDTNSGGGDAASVVQPTTKSNNGLNDDAAVEQQRGGRPIVRESLVRDGAASAATPQRNINPPTVHRRDDTPPTEAATIPKPTAAPLSPLPQRAAAAAVRTSPPAVEDAPRAVASPLKKTSSIKDQLKQQPPPADRSSSSRDAPRPWVSPPAAAHHHRHQEEGRLHTDEEVPPEHKPATQVVLRVGRQTPAGNSKSRGASVKSPQPQSNEEEEPSMAEGAAPPPRSNSTTRRIGRRKEEGTKQQQQVPPPRRTTSNVVRGAATKEPQSQPSLKEEKLTAQSRAAALEQLARSTASVAAVADGGNKPNSAAKKEDKVPPRTSPLKRRVPPNSDAAVVTKPSRPSITDAKVDIAARDGGEKGGRMSRKGTTTHSDSSNQQQQSRSTPPPPPPAHGEQQQQPPLDVAAVLSNIEIAPPRPTGPQHSGVTQADVVTRSRLSKGCPDLPPLPAPRDASNDATVMCAVVGAIGEFSDPKIARLPQSAMADAQALASMMFVLGYRVFTVPPNATRDVVVAMIRKALSDAGGGGGAAAAQPTTATKAGPQQPAVKTAADSSEGGDGPSAAAADATGADNPPAEPPQGVCFVYLAGRGVEGHLHGYDKSVRFLCHADTKLAAVSRHNTIILEDLVQLRCPTTGLQPIVMSEVHPMNVHLRSVHSSPDAVGQRLAFVMAGVKAHGSDMIIRYPPRINGGGFTWYLIKALQGDAVRSGTLTPTIINAFIKDSLLENFLRLGTCGTRDRATVEKCFATEASSWSRATTDQTQHIVTKERSMFRFKQELAYRKNISVATQCRIMIELHVDVRYLENIRLFAELFENKVNALFYPKGKFYSSPSKHVLRRLQLFRTGEYICGIDPTQVGAALHVSISTGACDADIEALTGGSCSGAMKTIDDDPFCITYNMVPSQSTLLVKTAPSNCSQSRISTAIYNNFYLKNIRRVREFKVVNIREKIFMYFSGCERDFLEFVKHGILGSFSTPQLSHATIEDVSYQQLLPPHDFVISEKRKSMLMLKKERSRKSMVATAATSPEFDALNSTMANFDESMLMATVCLGDITSATTDIDQQPSQQQQQQDAVVSSSSFKSARKLTVETIFKMVSAVQARWRRCQLMRIIQPRLDLARCVFFVDRPELIMHPEVVERRELKLQEMAARRGVLEFITEQRVRGELEQLEENVFSDVILLFTRWMTSSWEPYARRCIFKDYWRHYIHVAEMNSRGSFVIASLQCMALLRGLPKIIALEYDKRVRIGNIEESDRTKVKTQFYQGVAEFCLRKKM